MAEQMNVEADKIVVPEIAFPFLALQKGKLDPLKGDREKWLSAYRAALHNDYLAMRAYLPPLDLDQDHFVLDVGSGLGGIDILINRHYGGHTIPVLMDGARDKPVMELHRKTYNDMDVAEKFHYANGVYGFACIDANARPLLLPSPDVRFPLVISLGSWCFHYPPETYLDFVVENCEKGATIIVDVRKDRVEWRKTLGRYLKLKSIIHVSTKFHRVVFTNAK